MMRLSVRFGSGEFSYSEPGEITRIRLAQGSKLTGALVSCREARRELASGDKITLRISDPELGVLNGTGAVVERVSGRDITVRTEAGVLSLPTGSMAARGIDHAYAMTAHAYQGQTVPNIIIGMSVTPAASQTRVLLGTGITKKALSTNVPTYPHQNRPRL